MDRIHESLEFQGTYDEAVGLMDHSLVTVEKNCREMRDHVNEQRRSLINSLSASSSDTKDRESLEKALSLLVRIEAELVSIEGTCHEYRMKIGANVCSEVEQRLQPPSHVFLKADEKIIDLCGRALTNYRGNESRSTLGQCLRNWRNVSLLSLERTRDGVLGSSSPRLTKFDESDLKFKQQLMELRSKVFSMTSKRSNEDIADGGRPSIGTATKREFIETMRKSDPFVLPPLERELHKIGSLKFAYGEFKPNDAWTRLLDIYGQQFRSKWYLIVCPEIERILKRRGIAAVRLSSAASFRFVSRIRENGLNFELSRQDLASLVESGEEALSPKGTRMLLRSIGGQDLAATILQSCWRGHWVRPCCLDDESIRHYALAAKYLFERPQPSLQLIQSHFSSVQVRKSIYEAECKYIAASLIWVAWLGLKKRREMQEHYLSNMLISLASTRERCREFSRDFDDITQNEHVVVHLPSVGFPLNVRRSFGSRHFAVHQNSMALRFSSVKNPKARVIYVLPVKLTAGLLTMYRDVIESVRPKENFQGRVTFLELSQGETFADRAFNVTRTLHCSEETLVAIRRKIAGKPAYLLPWIMDECDLKLAGDLGLPLLASDVEVQHRLLNHSYVSRIIGKLGLEQPAHVPDIRDYETLCEKLAEQICLNPEISTWLLKLNVGVSDHVGVFLINHTSVPFVQMLRKEREASGAQWLANGELREDFLKSLFEHLPRVVSTVTRFSSRCSGWKDFHSHMTKHGCLLQAVPNEKSTSFVSVAMFVPDSATGQLPQWTGTGEKLYLASDSRCWSFAYAMPQSSVENVLLEPVVQRLTSAFQLAGYFGYLQLELCCYPRKRDDKLAVLVVETKPYYGHAQLFTEWIEFAIHGSYDPTFNVFQTCVPSTSQTVTASSTNASRSNETTQRYAVAIRHLFHPRFPMYSCKRLRALARECGILWSAANKRGAHLIFHDGTLKESVMLIAIAPSMRTAVTFVRRTLKKLRKALGTGVTKNDGNVREAIEFFGEWSRNC